MTGLWIGGYSENDPSQDEGYWDIAYQNNRLGDKTILRTWENLAKGDLYGNDYVVVYSYGCAELWHMLSGLNDINLPIIQKLLMITPVPRFWWGQTYFGKLWTVKENVLSATCYQIDSFPVSCPISNPIGNIYVNVNLNGRGLTHTSIIYDPYVIGLIMQELQNLRKKLTQAQS